MITFEKPIFKVVESNDNFAKIVVEPLERGFGVTLGNSLRRVLLSSIPGTAVRSIRIDGVMHEFSSIKGVVEDVTHIIINLKKIIFKMDSNEPVKVEINANKEGIVKAKDIIYDSNILQILNPEQEIATISRGGKLNMIMEINKGRGYVKTEQISDNSAIGTIQIDAIYTPVKNIVYSVDSIVSDKTYDRLNLEIETNGSINPTKALATASKILIQHLNNLLQVYDEQIQEDFLHPKKVDKILDNEVKTSIDTLELSCRCIKSLKSKKIETVQDLLDYSFKDLMKIKNLGKKSIEEIQNKLKERGYSLKEKGQDL